MAFYNSTPDDFKQAHSAWEGLRPSLESVGGEDSICAEMAFSLFLSYPHKKAAEPVLAPFFSALREEKTQGCLDLSAVWSHGLHAALDKDRLFSIPSVQSLKTLKELLYENQLEEVWLHSLLPRQKTREGGGGRKLGEEWILEHNATWWGNWLSHTQEYDSMRDARFFLSDVAQVNPSNVKNPFLAPLLSQSVFGYVMSLRRNDSRQPVFDLSSLMGFWDALTREGQHPGEALIRCVTLATPVLLNRSPEDIRALADHHPSLEYALFRGIASLNRVSDGFPTAHHYVMESSIRNPEVRAFVENQCLPEHRLSGLFQDWMDMLALKARHQSITHQTSSAPAL